MAHAVYLTGIWDQQGNLSFVDSEGQPKTGLMRPIEYLLASTIYCAGLTLDSILEKMKEEHAGLSIKGVAQVADGSPNWVESVDLDCVIHGSNLDDDQKARAIELTEKYCTVAQTLKRGAEVDIAVRTL